MISGGKNSGPSNEQIIVISGTNQWAKITTGDTLPTCIPKYVIISLNIQRRNKCFLFQEARKIIEEHDSSKPLFLYLPLMSIHSPHVGNAPKRYRHLYDSGTNSGFKSSEKMREILLASVDYALHKVFVDLKMRGMFDNSVILVTTDNGGGPWNSNLPLKGSKETLYEGGIRGASFITSPLLNISGYTYPGLVHITDWVPTLLGLAGKDAAEYCGWLISCH